MENHYPRKRPPRRRKKKSGGAALAKFIFIMLFMTAAAIGLYTVISTRSEAEGTALASHYIRWNFNTYAAPNLEAEVIGNFDSSEVSAYEIREDGWALISTDDGPQWAYTNSQIMFTTRPLGLFTNIGDYESVGILSPQGIKVIETYGDWVLTNTWMGEKWVYLNFTPPAYDLYNFFSQFGTELSVFYKNLDTGFVYQHNPDRVFFGASLSKINHAFYVYSLAEQGLIDMYEVHTFTAADYWGGTGIIRFKPAGTRFTTRELLAHSIIYSCNIAYRMLIRMTANSTPSYHDFVASIGAYPGFIRDVIAQNGSARDMGVWMYSINYYLESESNYGRYFLHDLMNTAQYSHHYFTRWAGSFGVGGDVNVTLIQSDYPMARKYGWTTNAFHDAAIIYGDSHYILVIMSNKDRGAHDLFEEISFLIQDFNREWF
ncbi:MAG: class A beta-lactamase-related serine hydrolase [Defluviitaleaceae bacterium]|nr:class A beta-lactamase-related serine hydrolase [Defluviitaleaceae bacterium]